MKNEKRETKTEARPNNNQRELSTKGAKSYWPGKSQVIPTLRTGFDATTRS
uniref:Uncharacterized protein n=1 Tax=Anguilla anguilla TaxID=7936 RepID=A0A0E9WPK3_ANGAN